MLPQFLTPGANVGWLLALGWSHAVLSLGYLFILIAGLNRAKRLLMRRRVRRGPDTATGAVLFGFSAKLATKHACNDDRADHLPSDLRTMSRYSPLRAAASLG